LILETLGILTKIQLFSYNRSTIYKNPKTPGLITSIQYFETRRVSC
jgi:hypothetical protein